MVSVTGALGAAKAVLDPYTKLLTNPGPERMDITIDPDDLLSAVGALVDESWGYLSAIVGIDRPAPESESDQPQAEGSIEVLYIFEYGAALVNLRVMLPYSKAVVPTISGMLPTAILYEWELEEMLGVEVIGLPMKGHLILADNWPEGVYPLRKSFTGFNGVASTEGA